MAEHAESGHPLPPLSSNPRATTILPHSSPGDDSRRTTLLSSGRGGPTNFQLRPQAPAFHPSENSFGQHGSSVARDLSNATRTLSGVTLSDPRPGKGHSDGMMCATAMKLQLIIIGYVSPTQSAQKNPARSTNIQCEPEVISHGIGNASLNADPSPTWSKSTSAAAGTGPSDRTNTSASHNRRPRKSSTGGSVPILPSRIA